jgi:deoxyribonuclease-4
MLLGCHLSIGKGFTGALGAAKDLDINAMQIFSHNASSWRMKEITTEAASSFQQCMTSSSVEYVVIHTMYLLNLASPDEALFERSIAALEEEISRAELLGIDQLVTHLGAHKLLEDTAGAGTTMGTTFSELGTIIDGLSDASRVGICFDTCHAFAAGYELRTPDGLAETLEEFDREIGLDRLCLIHLNDSKFPLGSRRDRHNHIGAGEIGEEAFSLIVNHPALRDLPFILETPKEIDGNPDADKINLLQVRSLRHE